jgi:hypothetical protein
MTQTPELTPNAKMFQLLSSAGTFRSIQVLAKLGVADHLGDSEKHVDELARATETHAYSLYRILRVAAAVGVFSETKDKTFANTPMSTVLRRGENSMLPLFLWHASLAPVSENLLYAVKTGKSAFEHVFGKPPFEYYAEHPDDGKLANEAMAAHSRTTHAAVVKAYDFSKFTKLTDVGGGYGALLTLILVANPKLEGRVFDLPYTINGGTQERMNAAGVGNRASATAGDFFKGVPGSENILMSHILHDWEDEACITILKNCRSAIARDGKLLVVEMLIPESRNQPAAAKHMDLMMMIVTGRGRERTVAEFDRLFQASGFKLARVVPTATTVSILEAEPI